MWEESIEKETDMDEGQWDSIFYLSSIAEHFPWHRWKNWVSVTSLRPVSTAVVRLNFMPCPLSLWVSFLHPFLLMKNFYLLSSFSSCQIMLFIHPHSSHIPHERKALSLHCSLSFPQDWDDSLIHVTGSISIVGWIPTFFTICSSLLPWSLFDTSVMMIYRHTFLALASNWTCTLVFLDIF